MKSNLKDIGVTAGVLLALWASNSVLAEENADQGADAPKEKWIQMWR